MPEYLQVIHILLHFFKKILVSPLQKIVKLLKILQLLSVFLFILRYLDIFLCIEVGHVFFFFYYGIFYLPTQKHFNRQIISNIFVHFLYIKYL